MPIYDLICTTCNKETYDFIAQSYKDELPLCSECGVRQEKVWRSSRYRPFKSFTETIGGKEIVIDSVAKIRQIERETAAAGHPHVWRAFSQNRSNMDRGVFGDRPDMGDPSRLTSDEKAAAHDLQQRVKGLLGRV